MLNTQQVLELATKLHEGQFRKDGKTPYITHPIRVADKAVFLYRVWKDVLVDKDELNEDIVRQIALLHDVLEDCEGVTEDSLIQMGVDPEVVRRLWPLNKKEWGNNYYDMITSMPYCGPFVDTIVKLADMADNLEDDPSGKQIYKYNRAFDFLTAALHFKRTCINLKIN